MDDAARAEVLPVIREILLGRIVVHLGLFLGVQVIEIAEEFIEAVHSGQKLVQVSQVVLAELSCRIAVVLEEIGDGHGLGLQTYGRGRDPDLREASAVDTLPGDEGGPPRGAGLLAVRVGEQHAFFREPVDIGGPVAHEPECVAAQVRDADVIPPDDENIGLFFSHDFFLLS